MRYDYNYLILNIKNLYKYTKLFCDQYNMNNVIKHYKIVNQKGGTIDPNKLNHPWYVYPSYGLYEDNLLYKL